MKYGIVLVLFLVLSICEYLYFCSKEKKLFRSLTQMLDNARNGTILRSSIDESNLSATENAFIRFLKDSAMLGENLNKQKNDIQSLISDISHQTTTPISNILLYTELLEEAELGERQKRYTQAIYNQAQKLEFLVEAMVKASRLENKIISTESKKEYVNELLEAVYNQAYLKATEKGVQICYEKYIDNIYAYFDMKWTKEAIFNILDNAIKYTPKEGFVEIKISKYTMFVRIDISDNGIGIPHDDISKIFQRFYRCENTRDESGVGLGLYLSREILKNESAYMKVKSKVNEGSTFSVFLPAQPVLKNNEK